MTITIKFEEYQAVNDQAGSTEAYAQRETGWYKISGPGFRSGSGPSIYSHDGCVRPYLQALQFALESGRSYGLQFLEPFQKVNYEGRSKVHFPWGERFMGLDGSASIYLIQPHLNLVFRHGASEIERREIGFDYGNTEKGVFLIGSRIPTDPERAAQRRATYEKLKAEFEK